MWDGKPFCCNGCKTVYQILNEKDLSQYYKITPMSGIKVDTTSAGDKYAYLDDEELKSKVLDFSDGGISKVRLFIPAIHCSSCIWLLENLNTLDPGIIYSSVNFVKKEVFITYNEEKTSLRRIAELLESIHYIPEISLEKNEDNKKSQRDILIKIGIAGFSFMNIMLYNFPEYLPGSQQLEGFLKDFFGWMSFALVLPVVFYCSNDYFLSAFKNLKKGLINIDLPIALGITTLFLQSSWIIFTGEGIGYMDSLTGLVFFLLIGKWYQNKTYQALSFERTYKSFFPVAVTRITDGVEEVVALSEIVPEDHILIRNHELIPTDSVLVKGNGNIDYSFVTGESLPVVKKEGNILFAGGRQIGSSIELEVTKSVDQSNLTQLWNQYKTRTESEEGIESVVNKVSQYFTVTILLIAVTAGIFWLIRDPSKAIFAFTSVLIIACPCALALTLPFTFGSTMRWFGRNGFYLKKSSVVERLSKTDTIVFDKTGTITYSAEMDTEWKGDELHEEELGMIRSVSMHSAHPVSRAITKDIPANLNYPAENYKEISGMGITAVVRGKKINIGSEEFVTGKTTRSEAVSTIVFINIDNQIKGYFIIHNRYRKGMEQVITGLSENYELHLISGDNDSEKERLLPVFRDKTRLHFNQSPENKLHYIRKLKSEGHKVLMVGDGLNDAGALNESDVGISIADDIFQFSPACDAILKSEEFRNLNGFMNFTRKAMWVVYASFTISFLYNVIGLSFAVGGNLSPIIAAILMPISSVSVVAFATLSISLLARFYKTGK
jgi:Cu+-exporting ATPase